MSRVISLAELTANGTRTTSVEGKFGGQYGLLCSGSFGGGDLAIEAGTISAVEPLLLTNPGNGQDHNAVSLSVIGFYSIEVECHRLDFVLTGSTTPSLFLYLFQPGRP